MYIFGLDPDPKALKRAADKVRRSGAFIQLDQGFSDQLPYEDHSFDRVLSSFMFHHLKDREKELTLQEVRRVLKPAGSFYIVDFEKPESGSKLSRWLHSNEHFKDNSVNQILQFIRKAGFADARSIERGRILFFKVAYYQANP